jgi:hypothetical protein
LEIISYSEVKNFFASTDSLTFQSNGKKIYILVEPSSYNHKSQEPYVRPSKYQIPLRFNDLNIYTCKNQYKVMYNKEPQMMMTSFTVLKPTGHNFSLIVFQQDDIQKTLAKLFQSALYNESNVPLNDSKVISEDLAEMIVTKLCWPNKKTAKKANKSSEASAKEEKTSSTKKSTAKKADTKSTAKTTEKKSTSAKKTDSKASSSKKTTAKSTAEKKTSTAKKSTTEKKTSTAKSDTKSTKTASSTKKTTAKKDTTAKTSAKKASSSTKKSTSKKTTDDDKTVVATKKKK